MDEALRCDRVALIHGGKILEIDPPRSIGARYGLPLIAVRGGNRFELLHTLREFPHARAVYLFGDELHYTDKRADAAPAIVARSARLADGKSDVVPDDVVSRGKTAAEKFLLRWRGEADPRHVQAIDTYWICTAEHGLNASTFTARIVASTGADCGAALSSAVGALSGPLHGGAPARVLPMLDAVAEMGDAEKWVSEALARKERIMGFGHRIYRAEDPRSRLLKKTAKELGSPRVEVAEALEQAAHEAIAKKNPDHSYTNVEFWSAIVLDVAEIPPHLAPAMFACSRTAGWSAHILEQRRLGVLVRPSAKYVGPGARTLQEV